MILRKLAISIIATGILVFGNSAHATLTPTGYSCTNSGMSFDDCSGSWDGNNKGNAGLLADVNAQILADFGFAVGSSYEVSSGGSNSGTLNFGGPISGVFAIALKAGDAFSLFKFDGGVSGISSINYDTLGVGFFSGPRHILHTNQDLSHADIYLPVPEPETYAMMLIGLGLIGFSLRNQKK